MSRPTGKRNSPHRDGAGWGIPVVAKLQAGRGAETNFATATTAELAAELTAATTELTAELAAAAEAPLTAAEAAAELAAAAKAATLALEPATATEAATLTLEPATLTLEPAAALETAGLEGTRTGGKGLKLIHAQATEGRRDARLEGAATAGEGLTAAAADAPAAEALLTTAKTLLTTAKTLLTTAEVLLTALLPAILVPGVAAAPGDRRGLVHPRTKRGTLQGIWGVRVWPEGRKRREVRISIPQRTRVLRPLGGRRRSECGQHE